MLTKVEFQSSIVIKIFLFFSSVHRYHGKPHPRQAISCYLPRPKRQQSLQCIYWMQQYKLKSCFITLALSKSVKCMATITSCFSIILLSLKHCYFGDRGRWQCCWSSLNEWDSRTQDRVTVYCLFLLLPSSLKNHLFVSLSLPKIILK